MALVNAFLGQEAGPKYSGNKKKTIRAKCLEDTFEIYSNFELIMLLLDLMTSFEFSLQIRI